MQFAKTFQIDARLYVFNSVTNLTRVSIASRGILASSRLRAMSASAYAAKKRSRAESDAVDTREKAVSPPPIKRRQQQSSVTQKAVANFFKPTSQKETVVEKVAWNVLHDTVIRAVYRPSEITSGLPSTSKKRKIAAFDFDSTLIVPSSGLKHSRDHNDWKWWHPSIPTTLKRLHEEQYILAIVTNQGGITLPSEAASKSKTAKSDGKRYQDFKRKVTAALTQLDLPIRLYGATERDIYRKPRVGMWRQLLHDLEEEHEITSNNDIDLDSCIFVGDAAGRIAGTTPNGTKINKDFSCSDRDIAANIGIPFKTPEEYFLNEAARPFERSFDPKAYLASLPETIPIGYVRRNVQDIVLSCGCPGAGKSSFYWRHLQPLGYERINQDILKSRDKCVEVATALLKEGKSVSVDNTNADPAVRAVWIKLAKSFKVIIRCVYFTAPARLCEHNDAVRALNADIETLNREKRTILPAVAFYGFAKRLVPPSIDEGFQDIYKVDFSFNGSAEDRAIWSQYWT